MSMLLQIILLTALVVSIDSNPPKGNLYALLVAGSKGWDNYRHQADVAHAYHVLLAHGVKKENIIVMMYDDIAYNLKNLYKGKIFNTPNGPDVYQGLNIDYRGPAVNIRNFLAVLGGDARAVWGGNGRVIRSTINDRIFVYFSDHGGSGVISFPEEVMTAKLLNDALLTMHWQGRFGQLVFYLEACESGSMFKNILRNDINVYAVTAANEEESSWAANCLPYTYMNIPFCLGDEFSVNWMENSDGQNLNYETLDKQFQLVKQWTKRSHVMRYGDLRMGQEPLSWFQGAGYINQKFGGSNNKSQHNKTSWPSRDVELMHWLEMKRLHPDLAAVDDEISRIKKHRKSIEATFTNLVNALVSDESERRRVLVEKSHVENLDCHHDVVQVFDLLCIDVNKHDYALQFINVLNNLCTKFNDSAKIIGAMWKACSETRSQFF